MKIQPLIIDNWYAKEEKQKIMQELDFYTSEEKIEKAEGNNVAHVNGEDLSNAFRLYPSQYYSPQGTRLSSILKSVDKFRNPNFHEQLKNTSPIFRAFGQTTRDTTLISYYEESQYYKPHFDEAKFTCLVWIFKEPKKFTGGDLILEDLNIKIKCMNNRLVVIPGFLLHEVTTIKMKKPYKFGDGRYTITHFFNN